MTYFAEIINGKVVRVIVATQKVIKKNYSGKWIETYIENDHTKNPRKNYAGIGFTLDQNNHFISPRPSTRDPKNEYILDISSKQWILHNKITGQIITDEGRIE